jgi:hypothetical protein
MHLAEGIEFWIAHNAMTAVNRSGSTSGKPYSAADQKRLALNAMVRTMAMGS